MGNKSQTEVIGLNSWTEFKDLVSVWVAEGIYGTPISRWVFRGHESEAFRLIASLDRRFPHVDPKTRLSLYEATLASMRESGEFAGARDMSDAEIGGLLQHFGAPTRLLDWTRSPYVAAYFAMMDTGAVLGEDAGVCCAIWLLSAESPIWQAQSGLTLQHASYEANLRARAQRAFFTQNLTLEPDLQIYVEEYHRKWPGTSLAKVTIPRDEASLALRELELMGVDAHALFPGTEGASRHSFFLAQERLGLI